MASMKHSERAAAARLEACRVACGAHPRERSRGASSFAFEAEDRGSKGEAAFLALFGLLGLGLIIGGLATVRRRSRLRISNDEVSFERRGLFSSFSFSEPLSAYLCIFPLSRLENRGQHRMGMGFYALLVHRSDPERNVSILLRSLDELGTFLYQGGERSPFESLARELDLPLATETAGGVEMRNPEELDKPLSARIEEGSVTAATGIEKPFPGRRYRLRRTESGWLAERGYLGYLFPFLAFALGCAALTVFGPDAEPTGPLALVLGAFACFMLAFALTRASLELRGDSLEASYRVAGFQVSRQIVPLGEIEEVVDGKDERSRPRALLVCSDKATIAWAQGGKPEEIAWFKEKILRAVGGLR